MRGFAGRDDRRALHDRPRADRPTALHAYVDLDGIDVGPGDEVIVHDAPTDIAFGEHAVLTRTATVRRAGPLQRAWAYIEGYLELTELYEVSFSDGKSAMIAMEGGGSARDWQRETCRAGRTANNSPRLEAAKEDTILSPRFYTTDFEAMDKLDVEPRARRVGRLHRPSCAPTTTRRTFRREGAVRRRHRGAARRAAQASSRTSSCPR